MKKYNKLIIAGGSGQMGTAIRDHFKNLAEEIIILTREKESNEDNVRVLNWDGKTAGNWWPELDGADIVINLAGKNVNCRYTEKNKKEIFNSRTNSIKALTEAVKKCKVLPKLWIQSASATIYLHAEDRLMNEVNGEIGEGFSVSVCKLWEKTFLEETSEFKSTRKVILRTSLVLGKKEGVYPRLKNLVRFCLGGRQGNSKQWVSWIHETDVANMVEWIADHNEISGEINCTSPFPLKNKDFMKVLRKEIKSPLALPSPAWLLELGAIVIGTETELILKSRWVLPDKISNAGYVFKLPRLEGAVRN